MLRSAHLPFRDSRATIHPALRSPVTVAAMLVIVMIVGTAVLAPILPLNDPTSIAPARRLQPAGPEFLLGTDAYGRDLLARIVYGARVSLIVGLGATILSVGLGLAIGLVAGFFRWADAILMRFMDGVMAIPGILLAIAVVSLSGASIMTVLFAITIPEVPRVARLVRSVVLSAREEPYVEAAIALGSGIPTVLLRHLMPNTIAPLLVQGTYVCASAILTEAILSFLGIGIGTETPTWGNIMAEGRSYFQRFPSLVLWPGFVLSMTILSINLLGDAARDVLDPRARKQGGPQ